MKERTQRLTLARAQRSQGDRGKSLNCEEHEVLERKPNSRFMQCSKHEKRENHEKSKEELETLSL